MKTVTETLSVSRSNLTKRLQRGTRPRRGYYRAHDAALLVHRRRLVAARPTYSCKRATALQREFAAEGLAPVNHRRIFHMMQIHGLFLDRHSGSRPERPHDGKGLTLTSNRPAAARREAPASTASTTRCLRSRVYGRVIHLWPGAAPRAD